VNYVLIVVDGIIALYFQALFENVSLRMDWAEKQKLGKVWLVDHVYI
jgi:hypothetical protein